MQSEGAQLLREWIDRRGFETQAAAAQFLDLLESQLSMFLNGHRRPTRDQAVVIEDRAGIPVRAWSLTADDKAGQPVSAGSGKSKNHKA